MLRRYCLSVVLLALVGWVLAPPAEAEGAKYVIKMATVAPKGSAWMEILDEYNEELKERTNGEVEFNFYPGGVAGDEPEVKRKILFGQLQAGGFAGSGLGHIVPEIRILEVPFIYQDYGDYEAVRDHIDGYIRKRFEEEGFVFIGWAEAGFTYFYSKKKLQQLQDIAGAKPWVWNQDEVGKTWYETMGIQPIPVAVPDVLTSLKTGYIHSVYSSPIVMVAFQWFEGVRYVVNLKINPIPASLLIQKKFFESLPKEYQDIVLELGEKYTNKIIQRSRADDEESKKVLEEKGIQWVEPSKVAVRQFRISGIKTAKALVGKLYTKEFLQDAMNALKEHRKAEAEK